MKGTVQNISIDNLINYFENPRHVVGNNEKDTLKKLFEAVGKQHMLNLAEDICKNGLLRNQQIVVVYSGKLKKYVVYEGNRRIAAIKMLLNPEYFDFLDKSTVDRIKHLQLPDGIKSTIPCYVTEESEAFFIMERIHSGDDKGRGVRQWTAREKEVFKARQSSVKTLPFLLDFYIKKYFDGFDITSILPFTTLKRIFDPREIKKKIGIDVSDENTFTKERMQLIIDASKWIVEDSNKRGQAVTRLYNRSRDIEDALLPWIDEYLNKQEPEDINITEEQFTDAKSDFSKKESPSESVQGNGISDAEKKQRGMGKEILDNKNFKSMASKLNSDGSGSSKNLPYFFQGLNYGMLDPNDADSHGIAAVCRELQLFSEGHSVEKFPLAATFLTRAMIEQALIYYSKKNKIQGQDKYIWDNIKTLSKLSKIIDNYKKNLPNYILDSEMRQYFISLFGDYEKNVDPLNWVIHRTASYKLDAQTLVDLPRKGLLSLINYLIAG